MPQDGVTVKLCVNGSIVYYASQAVPNPNGALNDYTQTVTGTDACNAAYVRPESTEQQSPTQQPGGQNSSIDGGSLDTSNVTLYLSLEGVQERNQFVMETLEGDHTEKGKHPVILLFCCMQNYSLSLLSLHIIDQPPQDRIVVVVPTLIIMGAVLLVVFIFVFLVVFCFRRRKQKQKD